MNRSSQDFSASEDATAQATLESGLRPVRVVLSLAFLGIVLSAGGDGLLSLSSTLVALAMAVAIANSAVNAALMLPGYRSTPSGSRALLQLGADGTLALLAIVTLDPTATPLAWIALLLPVLDATVRFGAVAGGATWIGLSFSYITLRLQVSDEGGNGVDVLGLALQQLAAVAVVAIPTGFLAARLRDDVDRARMSRNAAEERSRQLSLVAASSLDLTTAEDSNRTIELALSAAVALGFERVDICEKHSGSAWRIRQASGSRPGPDPSSDVHLSRAIETDSVVTLGMGSSDGEVQQLHLHGYQAGVVAPLYRSSSYALALRAWTVEPLKEQSSRLHALSLLTSQAASAWRNATTFSELVDWSTRLEHAATHDTLTQLPNRAYLLDSLEQSLKGLGSAESSLAVLFLDLDGFKDVNDFLGHEAGDAALIAVAERLSGRIRPSDVAARLGGDEFVVMTKGFSHTDEVLVLAGRIAELVAEPISVAGSTAQLGASIGIAYAVPGQSADDVLKAADHAMYAAKRDGDTMRVAA